MSISAIPNLPNDNNLNHKVKNALERISENIHISANEPSLAVYRLQEHVRKALPPTVNRRYHAVNLHSQLQGACYDVEYGVQAVQTMKESSESFISIQELLKSAIFHRQQLKYELSRRKKEPSMYKRFSSHLTSIEMPDFHEIPEALRETASRVESALHHARTSYETRKDKRRPESQVSSLPEEQIDAAEDPTDKDDFS